jgi:acyl carrier protein
VPTALKGIEAMLAARLDIADATVVEYDAEGPVLVLVKPNNFCSGLEVRDECGTALGDSGSRVIVVLTDDLPRPPDGFPDPESVLGDAAYVYRYEPPATSTERLMVSLWNDVLGRRMTGATDDFLDLGGDSVLAVRIVAKISQDFGVDVGIAAFFDAVSIRELAALVDNVRNRRNLQ